MPITRYLRIPLLACLLFTQVTTDVFAQVPELQLTEAERSWLAENPAVRFTGDPNWLPYEAFDADGEYIGIVAEHLRLISERAGITFEMSPSETWTESTEKAREGLVDILSETDDSDLSSHLVFTSNYLSNPIVIAMHNRENYVEGITKISDRKIALIRDYGYASKIRRGYPQIAFETVDDIQDGLLAVSTGKVDALLCTLALCTYTISELGLNNVRIVGKSEFDTKLALGVQKNLPELVSILNKAIATITPGEQQVILDGWIKQKFAARTDYSLVYQVVAVAVLLLAFFIFWNRRLAHEVTLRMATEKELNQEIKERERVSSELEIQNAELERFAYTVSHDLKSPLVTITGFLDLLRADIAAENAERIGSDMDKINHAAEKMSALLEDLLELGRIGRVVGDPVACDLSEIARQASQLVDTTAREQGIEVTIDEMPEVEGDATRLVEVFQNLIENAVKFMGDQDSPRIHIGSEESDDWVRCFVRDNGVGIAPEYHDQVFGLFERLSSRVGGSGVGLALVRRIIEVHGGKIWVDSDGSGRGSTFWLTLPRTAPVQPLRT